MANQTINPQGYNYGISPKNINPFWGDGVQENGIWRPTQTETADGARIDWSKSESEDPPAPVFLTNGKDGEDGADGVTPSIDATATVDDTTGNPSVIVTRRGTDTAPTFDFDFTGLVGATGADGAPGARGADGTTPDIDVFATVDDSTGTPTVAVTKAGTAENPRYTLAFTGLKGATGADGAPGATGETGATGATGATGETGATPDITMTATVTQDTGTATVTVEKSGTTENPVFSLAFDGIKGQPGQDGANGTNGADGVTPDISATASVDSTSGNPSVTVEKSGTAANPSFAFNFTGLVGATGAAGKDGVNGTFYARRTTWTGGQITSDNLESYSNYLKSLTEIDGFYGVMLDAAPNFYDILGGQGYARIFHKTSTSVEELSQDGTCSVSFIRLYPEFSNASLRIPYYDEMMGEINFCYPSNILKVEKRIFDDVTNYSFNNIVVDKNIFSVQYTSQNFASDALVPTNYSTPCPIRLHVTGDWETQNISDMSMYFIQQGRDEPGGYVFASSPFFQCKLTDPGHDDFGGENGWVLFTDANGALLPTSFTFSQISVYSSFEIFINPIKV